ncbi:hypothetical protein ITG09_14180 [Vibrio cyclitrophicus]|nr:hypothetical protein [Vibrio cyclitrophicus]UPR51799.1 hypothetical protein ITG09_14180 [Vibrio cyclitrophicus]
MKVLNSFLVVLITTTLSACGGGSDSSSGNDNRPDVVAKTMSGKVISGVDDVVFYSRDSLNLEGYVAGAKVFIDINNNGVYDEGEPHSRSTKDGEYTLELTSYQAECASVVPAIVTIPENKICEEVTDEDGNVTESCEVEEAYEMVIPPSYDPLAELENRHVSPLTSMLWNSIESNKEYAESSKGMHCDDILADQSSIETASNILDSQLELTSTHYNISEADIYSDYVSRGDYELVEKATRMVKGLQKGYAETVKEQANYPSNVDVSISYTYSEDDDSTITWNKVRNIYTYVEAEYEHWDFSSLILEDDLETLIRVDNRTDHRTDFNIDRNYVIETIARYNVFDDGGNHCEVTESLVVWEDFADGQKREYKVYNLMDKDVDTFEECNIKDGYDINATVFRSVDILRFDYPGSWDSHNQYRYGYNQLNLQGFDEYFNILKNQDSFDIPVFVELVKGLVKEDFETTVIDGNADTTMMEKTYIDGQNKVHLGKQLIELWDEDAGEYGDFVLHNTITRTTTFPDFTWTKELSTDNGITWEDITDESEW